MSRRHQNMQSTNRDPETKARSRNFSRKGRRKPDLTTRENFSPAFPGEKPKKSVQKLWLEGTKTCKAQIETSKQKFAPENFPEKGRRKTDLTTREIFPAFPGENQKNQCRNYGEKRHLTLLSWILRKFDLPLHL